MDTSERIGEALDRLQRIEAALGQLVSRQPTKDFYTVDEFGAIVSRTPFTVREWARLGRINAEKRKSGRGKYQEWVISHEELLRYERHGLLPLFSSSGKRNYR
jgi:hypothetical protein